MIYTITLNPSIDYSMSVKDMSALKINRSEGEVSAFGGKGINVSAMLKNLGVDSTVLGFAGGYTGREIERLCVRQGLFCDFVKIREDSRINVKVISEKECAINGKGPMIYLEEEEELLKKLSAISEEDIVILSGKAPESESGNLLEKVIEAVSHTIFVADMDGASLDFAIEKLNNLLPKTTTILVDGKEKIVLNAEVKVGDTVVLKAGDYVTVDGEVIKGKSGIDCSAITGKSIPKEVSIGDFVSSGSILKEGYLLIKATAVKEDTLFSKIVETVKKAGASKAPVQKFADKIAGIFVPIVLGIALLTFVIWLISTADFYSAFNFSISVLVVSCPCALGLATPVAVVSATGMAAKHGILFKNAQALENAGKINLILLDKTATLTIGKPLVTNYLNFTEEANEVIFPLVSALEEKSSHPLANCVKDFCGKSGKEVLEYEYTIGKGANGKIDGVNYFIGNDKILPNGVEIPILPKEFENKTVIYFADEIQLISAFAIADVIKEDAKETIKELNEQNIKAVMLTGDNYGVAKRVASEVGISDFEAQVLPEDKYLSVEKYKNDGYYTAMVGDGINDSPALKSSMVGIAMGTGTDVAIDSADVVIANGNLLALVKTIEISKKSFKIIKQNLFWAFIYNLLAIPVAGGALTFLGITLTPAIASALMCVSSIFVVTNASRLAKGKKVKGKKTKIIAEYQVLIDGMHCNHCVSKVLDALSKINGVANAEVSLKTNSATLKIDKKVAEKDICSVVEKVGFFVKDIIRK